MDGANIGIKSETGKYYSVTSKIYGIIFVFFLQNTYLCRRIYQKVEKMKKVLFLFLMLCSTYELHAVELNGKYVSLSGELMFRFSGDSLYIDIAQSQRNVSSFKLIKRKETQEATTYNAFEHFMKDGRETYREVFIRISRVKDESYLLEYFGKDKDREYNSNERYVIKPVK